MDYQFVANFISIDDSGSVSIVGFSDDELDPKQFVILQQACEYDEQDKKMGMDKILIEINSQIKSQYGGILFFSVANDRLIIGIDADSQNLLGIDGNIVIALEENSKISEAIAKLKVMANKDSIKFKVITAITENKSE